MSALQKMIKLWESKDNFCPGIDLSKAEAAFYKVAISQKICLLDGCIYANSSGCRVHDLGVEGVTSCIKFKQSLPKAG